MGEGRHRVGMMRWGSQSAEGPGRGTHRAAIVGDSVGEAAVAFGPELDLVGALEEQGLLEVACLLVHVGHAVLAVVRDVLGGLGGHQAQEGQLDGHVGGVGVLAAVLELQGQGE